MLVLHIITILQAFNYTSLMFGPASAEGVTFETFQPIDARLKGLVAYYYLHRSTDPDFRLTYTYYPHWRNGLTLYKGAEVLADDQRSLVSGSSRKASPIALFSKNYHHAIEVHMSGEFTKLGIAFEALGFNHFIEQELSLAFPNTVSSSKHFMHRFSDLLPEHPHKDWSLNVSDLEQLLLAEIKSFKEERLKQAVGLLIHSEELPSVEQLAAQVGVSRKTLLRDFEKHLACSVTSYRKMVRFRKAMNHYQQQAGTSRFTDLALENNYYDQAAFIRHFKEVSGLTPRQFFRMLEQFGQEDTFWRKNP